LLPKEKHSFFRRLPALVPLIRGKEGASRLAESILAAWLNRSFPGLARKGLNQDKALRAHPKVQALAVWLSEQELPDAVFLLASAYAYWVGAEVRGDRAMFFTPPALSARLIENLLSNGVDFTRGHFMDPACGGAAFLAPIALCMRQKLREKGRSPRQILEHVRTHLSGVDLDPTLCRLSTFFIKMALYEDIVATGYQPIFDVKPANALTDLNKRYGHIDVLLCNPPYRKMPRAEVDAYREKFKAIVEGQPNIYTLFFGLAVKLLRPGGTAAFLTATSFLSGQYFSKLRTYLLEKTATKQIDIVGARTGVFVGAELETAITVFTKRERLAHVAEETSVFALREGNGFDRVGAYVLPNSGTAWPIPRSVDDAAAIRTANGSVFRLKDYGYCIRIGAFVWNRDKRKTFQTEKAAKKGKAPIPLIWSSDIGKNGRFVFNRSEAEKRDAFVDMRNANNGSIVRRPCVVLQRVTSNDQPRRLVGAAIPISLMKRFGGILGENHVVFLEQISSKPALRPRLMAKVLRSQPMDQLFRSISGSANVSAFELSQLPMPAPHRLAEQLKQTENMDTAVLDAFRPQKE